MGFEARAKGPGYCGGILHAKPYDETKATIQLTKEGKEMTQVDVRVGTVGDREKSEIIYAKIVKELEPKQELFDTKPAPFRPWDSNTTMLRLHSDSRTELCHHRIWKPK